MNRPPPNPGKPTAAQVEAKKQALLARQMERAVAPPPRTNVGPPKRPETRAQRKRRLLSRLPGGSYFSLRQNNEGDCWTECRLEVPGAKPFYARKVGVFRALEELDRCFRAWVARKRAEGAFKDRANLDPRLAAWLDREDIEQAAKGKRIKDNHSVPGA